MSENHRGDFLTHTVGHATEYRNASQLFIGVNLL